MPCRVGITTRPEQRKQEWKNAVVGFKEWRIVERGLSRQKAQEREDHYANLYRCVAHHGGENATGLWCVYKFSYVRDK